MSRRDVSSPTTPVIVVAAGPASRLGAVLARPAADAIVAVAPCAVLVLPVRD